MVAYSYILWISGVFLEFGSNNWKTRGWSWNTVFEKDSLCLNKLYSENHSVWSNYWKLKFFIGLQQYLCFQSQQFELIYEMYKISNASDLTLNWKKSVSNYMLLINLTHHYYVRLFEWLELSCNSFSTV